MGRSFTVKSLLFVLLLSLGIVHATAQTELSTEALITSEDFVALSLDDRLLELEAHSSKLSQTSEPTEWALSEYTRMSTISQMGDFKTADKIIDDIGGDLLNNLKDTKYYGEALYGFAAVKLQQNKVEDALIIADELERLPNFSTDLQLQQHRDTIMIALHSLSGNGLLAADVFIRKLERDDVNQLSEFEILKLYSNLGYSLMVGQDFERAQYYLDIGRTKLEEFSNAGSLNRIDSLKVRFFLNANYAEMLIAAERYNEIAAFEAQLKNDADELGADFFKAAYAYSAAGLAFGEDRLEDATSFIEQAIDLGQTFSSLMELRHYHILKAKILSASGDAEAALDAYLTADAVEKSMQKEQTRARALFVLTAERLSAESAEIASLKAKAELAARDRSRNEIIAFAAFSAFLLLAVFAFVLYGSRQRLSMYAERLEESERRAQESVRAKSSFLANMSHEIRTPLNGLLGMAQLLAQKTISYDQKQLVDVMMRSGHTLLTIVNDVLDLSKIEAGKMRVEPTPTDIRSLFSDLETLWRPLAEEKSITMSVDLKADLPSAIDVDAVRLRQCISNLISNAVKFTPKGDIAISANYEEEKDLLFVSVQDTGVGIAAVDHTRLFGSFEQADDSTTRSFSGTGLGLTITRELAIALGGNVTCESVLGAGSTFILSVRAPVSNIVSRKIGEQDFKPELEDIRDKRILLVEDHDVNRLLVRSFLKGKVKDVVDAENGKVALDILESGKVSFDLILLDMHMPVMDGPMTINAIRGSKAPYSDIPIIVITADAMEGDQDKYLALGTDGYVSKPVIAADLFGEFNRVIKTRI